MFAETIYPKSKFYNTFSMSHVEAFKLDMGKCSGGLVRTNPIKHKDFAIFEV